ncbi:Hypothetical protein D9617_13g101110 [Elsinoe fawcettii]|nr:Hypothetical protein D9617_13g101110 [Elsinoe fawcettii]
MQSSQSGTKATATTPVSAAGNFPSTKSTIQAPSSSPVAGSCRSVAPGGESSDYRTSKASWNVICSATINGNPYRYYTELSYSKCLEACENDSLCEGFVDFGSRCALYKQAKSVSRGSRYDCGIINYRGQRSSTIGTSSISRTLASSSATKPTTTPGTAPATSSRSSPNTASSSTKPATTPSTTASSRATPSSSTQAVVSSTIRQNTTPSTAPSSSATSSRTSQGVVTTSNRSSTAANTTPSTTAPNPATSSRTSQAGTTSTAKTSGPATTPAATSSKSSSTTSSAQQTRSQATLSSVSRQGASTVPSSSPSWSTTPVTTASRTSSQAATTSARSEGRSCRDTPTRDGVYRQDKGDNYAIYCEQYLTGTPVDTTQQSSYDGCLRQCDMVASCAAFVYKQSSRGCILLRDVSGRKVAPGYDSGLSIKSSSTTTIAMKTTTSQTRSTTPVSPAGNFPSATPESRSRRSTEPTAPSTAVRVPITTTQAYPSSTTKGPASSTQPSTMPASNTSKAASGTVTSSAPTPVGTDQSKQCCRARDSARKKWNQHGYWLNCNTTTTTRYSDGSKKSSTENTTQYYDNAGTRSGYPYCSQQQCGAGQQPYDDKDKREDGGNMMGLTGRRLRGLA